MVPAVPYSEDPGEVWTSVIYVEADELRGSIRRLVSLGRRTEYRTPDDLSISIGSAWSDADENTALRQLQRGRDAYLLQIDPTGGLAAAHGWHRAPPTRYKPIFKIRRWQSLAPPIVTLNGTPLTRDVQFKSDVKPLARAHQANRIVHHTTLDSTSATTPPGLDIGTDGDGFNAGYT